MRLIITEVSAVRSLPDGGYPGAVSVDVMFKSEAQFLPTPYRLRVQYIDPQGKIVDSETDQGFIKAGEERGFHSESSWSADKVQAIISIFGLGLLADSEVVEPQ